MVREFKLINEKGQEYSLMDIKNYCLLTDPSGLGYAYSTSYERIGNTFVENLRQIEQGPISGTVNFSKYDNYKNFIDFIEKSENLYFSYKIPFQTGVKEYLKDINVQSITKTEIQTNGIISENIEFDCLSMWYDKTTAVYNMESSENEVRWNFIWDSKFVEYTTRSLKYVNKGHVEAPILVEIYGEVVNPVIEIYIEGELYQRVPFNVRIETNEKLLYGSRENNFYINKQNTNGTIEDLFDLDIIDFENDNVIRLPKNKSCEIRLTAEDDIRKAVVTILAHYKTI